ncbi:MAG: hypothetical protein ACRC2T_01645, partial [Thermoguttaceae bacterium]
MTRTARNFLFLFLCFLGFCSVASAQIKYPSPHKSDDADVFFGVTVADPYRWMEESSPELDKWIAEENEITQNYFNQIPNRDALREKITEVINYPKYSLPWTKEGKLFFFKNNGLQNQSVLYVVDDFSKKADGSLKDFASINSEARVLLDPNKLSETGTVALGSMAISKNGKLLAFGLAKSGSDWNDIQVLDIDSGKFLVDKVEWAKFTGISWDGDGFYYSRYDAPED